MKNRFGYEDLEVWNRAIDFAIDIIGLTDNIITNRKHYRLLEQMESSAVSVPMNIAEGKGRFSKKEFTQYLYIARGSLYETMTLFEIFKRKGWITDKDYSRLENEGKQIASMIKGLINSIK